MDMKHLVKEQRNEFEKYLHQLFEKGGLLGVLNTIGQRSKDECIGLIMVRFDNVLNRFIDLEINRLKDQIKIHKHIINTHDIAPFEWHKGRITEAEENVVHFVDLKEFIK